MLTAGPFGITPGVVATVDGWDDNGDGAVSANGLIDANGDGLTPEERAELVLAERARGIGLASPFLDDPYVAVQVEGDPSAAGYYRFVDFNASTDVDLSPANGVAVVAWSAALVRLPVGAQVGQYDCAYQGGLRVNNHTIDTSATRPWVTLPPGAGSAIGLGGLTVTNIAAADGTTVRHLDGGTSGTRNKFFGPGRYGYLLPPDTATGGACSIEISGHRTVGRQVPNDPADWVISNEISRVRPGASGALIFGWHDGSQWDEISFTLTSGTSGPPWTALAADPIGIAVNRDSPECVSIKLRYPILTHYGYTLDLTLRRGARYVEGYMQTGDAVGTWGIRRSTTEAATALTGGIRATSNDPNGNRFILAVSNSATNDLTNGGVRRSASTQSEMTFMVGCEVSGSSAADPLDAQTLLYAYYSPVDTQARVVIP